MLQEPGFLWDLYFAFYLNFNYESILERNSYNILREDWIEQYNNISIIFGKIPDDLKIFFYPIGEDNLNFVSAFYLSCFKHGFQDGRDERNLDIWEEICLFFFSYSK